MDRHRAQRQPMMGAICSVPAETRLATSKGPPAGKDLTAFRSTLLRWFDENRRDLPWRENRDPYRIWLSEIMLQQTRVAAVLDYYRKFLKRFPNVQILAAASENAVLAAWSGLGYYRRARMLHKCAKELVEKRGGRFPQNADVLRGLPGIGRYTAAAIASIAFGKPVAVVDGNVERVLQRFTGIDLSTAETWQHAQSLLADTRPGDFNQAMMELGATICVPGEPRCLACPVRKWCVTQGKLARRETLSRQKRKQLWCALEQRSSDGAGKIRLVQRSAKASLMPGMWELPQSSEPPQPSPDSAHWRTFRHSITVTDYTVHVLRNTPLKKVAWPDAPPTAKGKWIAIGRISQIPITGLTRKILKAGGII
jgi:A/G-specific adenine glycosylase